jgi:hypothetical protein
LIPNSCLQLVSGDSLRSRANVTIRPTNRWCCAAIGGYSATMGLYQQLRGG